MAEAKKLPEVKDPKNEDVQMLRAHLVVEMAVSANKLTAEQASNFFQAAMIAPEETHAALQALPSKPLDVLIREAVQQPEPDNTKQASPTTTSVKPSTSAGATIADRVAKNG